MKTLHSLVMNLPVGTPGWAGNDLLLYKEGHRDARHAAAELAAAQDALVDELATALQFFVNHPGVSQLCTKDSKAMVSALAALAKLEPQQ